MGLQWQNALCCCQPQLRKGRQQLIPGLPCLLRNVSLRQHKTMATATIVSCVLSGMLIARHGRDMQHLHFDPHWPPLNSHVVQEQAWGGVASAETERKVT